MAEQGTTTYDTQATQAARNRYKVLPWFMCILGAMFYFYEYLLRVSPSVMTSNLMLSYHINAAALGNLSAFYYYIYAPMQMPVGVLMDRYGPRRLLTVAAFTCAIGTYLFASSTHLSIAEVGRFLVGFGSAFAFVGVLKLATIWLPPERFAFISGITLMLGMIGGMTGDILLTSMVTKEGWRLTSYMAACFGILLTLILYLVIRDVKKYREVTGPLEKLPSFKSAFEGLFTIIKNPQVWVNGLIGCLVYLPTSVFAELWGIPYLKVAYNFSSTEAAHTVSMIFLGWAVGGPVLGWFSDYIKQRKLLITIGAAFAAILLSIVFYVPGVSKSVVFASFFIFGFFSSTQILVFPIAREISPNRSAGTAIALTNMFVMVGGVIFQPLVGILLDFGWSGQTIGGLQVYSATDYQFALSMLPLGLIITVFLSLFLQETYCKLHD